MSSVKNRDYFITINKGAPCYEEITDIIASLNFKMYGLITHDKDYIIGDNDELTLKTEHKHLMIELKNPVSFESMLKKFPGSHIEVPKYKKSAYQYLIHNRPNAKDKYQYDFNDIITNAPQELKFTIESEDFELFKENMFLEYIADGTRTSYQFCKRFGLNAFKQYWSVYERMLNESLTDPEMISDLEKICRERNDNELPW